MSGIARAPVQSSRPWVRLLNQTGLTPGTAQVNFDSVGSSSVYREIVVSLFNCFVNIAVGTNFSFGWRLANANVGATTPILAALTLDTDVCCKIHLFNSPSGAGQRIAFDWDVGFQAAAEHNDAPAVANAQAPINYDGFRFITGSGTIDSIGRILVEGLPY